ncbi:U2 small nuclear ribonucleoprotein A' [Diutina catenulata]
MRLSPEAIAAAPRVLNPEGELVLQLRNLQLTHIANLGVARDDYAVLDVTNNHLRELAEVPATPHLHTVLAANNQISQVSFDGAYVVSLSLANNNLASMASMRGRFPRLRHLVVAGNPLGAMYRDAAIWLFPTLYSLDYQRVTSAERERVAATYGSVDHPTDAGRDLLLEPAAAGSGYWRSSIDMPSAVAQTVVKKLTPAERKQLLARLASADTIDEIESIESALNRGTVDDVLPAPRIS